MSEDDRRLGPLRRVCRLDELLDGQVRVVTLAEGMSPNSILVLRSGDAVHAFENRCPHFGVVLAQRQEHMIYVPHASLSCNVHYARFRWQDGYCESGDCRGESLTAVAVELRGGEVFLTAA